MKRISYLFILILGALMLMPVCSAADTNATEETQIFNQTTLISLEENPTTGYSWNVTNSSGLEIISDTYIAPDSAIPGRGGTHEWLTRAIEKGDQTFSAIYKRPWENVTGNERTYTLTVKI